MNVVLDTGLLLRTLVKSINKSSGISGKCEVSLAYMSGLCNV